MQLPMMKADHTPGTALEVQDDIFGREFNEALVHQIVVAYQAGARQGTHAQKTRAEVRGSGKKPWKQKGTGRARAGSSRSPIWVGGGRAHPARPDQNYTQKVNRKMYQGALRSILSELVRQERLTVIENLTLEGPNTKALKTKIAALGLTDVLIVTDVIDEALYLSERNFYYIGVDDAATIDPVSLIGYKSVLMTVAAVKELEERLA